MEIDDRDCAFPLLAGVVCINDPDGVYKDADHASRDIKVLVAGNPANTNVSLGPLQGADDLMLVNWLLRIMTSGPGPHLCRNSRYV